MYERCLNEAERILASEKDVIVPVKKIWKEVERQGKNQGFEIPSLADFTALLEGDRRFEFMPSHTEDGEPFDDVPTDELGEEPELESLGFYSGDRVKLKNVELTPEVIGGLIRRKVDMTMDALTKAWEQRPGGDQETEDQLLDILARTQKLQREVKRTFSEEKMKQLSLALKRSKKRAGTSNKAKPKRQAKRRRPTAKKHRTKKSPTVSRRKRGPRK
ncbi:MAG: hypothetical protein FJ217_00090 [Ignavibacteria bacterium]|nr:hypothetical protein [Ignavibacteria bacterium]